MEPISTIIACCALLAQPTPLNKSTVIPSYNAEKIIKNNNLVSSLIREYSNKKTMDTDVVITRPNAVFPLNNLSEVVLNLLSYKQLEAGWDGQDSIAPSVSDIESAVNFVESIPSVFPLPKAMLSCSGVVGLYWNDKIKYADIQFDSDMAISIFLRNRSTGKEEFIELADVSAIDSNWYFDTFSEFFSYSRTAIAA